MERTGAGSLLLYRLFENYPAANILIIQRTLSETARRLPGVNYLSFDPIPRKIYWNRLNPFKEIIFAWTFRKRFKNEIKAAIDSFGPEILISVANGYLWFLANEVSRKINKPLYLFLHEDWPNLTCLYDKGLRKKIKRIAGDWFVRKILKSASKLFSISPGMRQLAREKYGLESQLLFPTRGNDSPEPINRVDAGSNGRNIAHCGFVHLKGNAELLEKVGEIQEKRGVFLDHYTISQVGELGKKGISFPPSRVIGFFPPKEMCQKIVDSSLACIVTASFREEDRQHEASLFPSKMADYTAIGLPIIVWGPPHSSVVKWAKQNGLDALVVDTPDCKKITALIHDLDTDLEFRKCCAQKCLDAGSLFFGLDAVKDFHKNFAHE